MTNGETPQLPKPGSGGGLLEAVLRPLRVREANRLARMRIPDEPEEDDYVSAGYPYAGYPIGPDRLSTLAVVAFVLAFFLPIAGLICAFIAMSDIRRTGERGWGLAFSALIVSFLIMIGGALLFLFVTVSLRQS